MRLSALPARALSACLLLCLSLPLPAAETIRNGAEPLRPPRTLAARELWRIGGDSPDENQLFGLIIDIAVDDAGRILLLDNMLHRVQVFDADGAHLRTLGREGEGPGEFRRGVGLLLPPDGSVAVLQSAPPRIARLSREGRPLDDLRLAPDAQGEPVDYAALRPMGDGLAAMGTETTFVEGAMDQLWRLDRLAANGAPVARLHAETRRLDFTTLRIEETVWNTFQERWEVAPDGRLFAALEFAPYRIHVWNADGTGERTIERKYEHRGRDAEDLAFWTAFYGAMLARVPNADIRISPRDPDILRLYPRDDGSLWVLTSRGLADRPEGAIGVFDVFDADGRFVRQVTLLGDADPMDDKLLFAGDRLYVVTDLMSAVAAGRGAGFDDDAEPMSVICHALE